MTVGNEGTGQQDVKRYESGQIAKKPQVTDEQKQKAAEMRRSYDEDRPTTVLPGSDHTVTGKAVTDWTDDEGNPKFGDGDTEIPEDEGHRTLKKTDDRENVADAERG